MVLSKSTLEFYKAIINNNTTSISFANKNSINFLNSINKRTLKTNTFIYCDPPYLKTRGYRNSPKWTQDDLNKLINKLLELKVKFAISEFEKNTLDISEKYNLNRHIIKEQRNLNDRQTEVILTNY